MEADRPALVLLDLGLSEMDGFEVLEQMRGRASTREIPVIVVTLHPLTDKDVERLNHGVATILGVATLLGGFRFGHPPSPAPAG